MRIRLARVGGIRNSLARASVLGGVTVVGPSGCEHALRSRAHRRKTGTAEFRDRAIRRDSRPAEMENNLGTTASSTERFGKQSNFSISVPTTRAASRAFENQTVRETRSAVG